MGFLARWRAKRLMGELRDPERRAFDERLAEQPLPDAWAQQLRERAERLYEDPEWEETMPPLARAVGVLYADRLEAEGAATALDDKDVALGCVILGYGIRLGEREQGDAVDAPGNLRVDPSHSDDLSTGARELLDKVEAGSGLALRTAGHRLTDPYDEAARVGYILGCATEAGGERQL